MKFNDYIKFNAEKRASLDSRILKLENDVAKNTQDISDNTDAIAELGELTGGEPNG